MQATETDTMLKAKGKQSKGYVKAHRIVRQTRLSSSQPAAVPKTQLQSGLVRKFLLLLSLNSATLVARPARSATFSGETGPCTPLFEGLATVPAAASD